MELSNKTRNMKIVKTTVTIQKQDHETAEKFIYSKANMKKLSIAETIDRLIRLTENLNKFWSKADGWAPIEAAELLSKSRLDWQVSLTHCLKYWVKSKPSVEDSGNLILAWVNLGSLVEGAMKLFLSVWYKDYIKDIAAFKKKNKVQDPDGLSLEPLRQFFHKKIWNQTWNDWVIHIQQRRNLIHAFKSKDLGSREELINDFRTYLDLLRYINFRLPYPDDIYIPRET